MTALRHTVGVTPIPETAGRIGEVLDVGGALMRLREWDRADDRACIATRWVKSACAEHDIDPALQGALVDRLLDSPRSRVVVVCSEAVPSTVLAWACAMADPKAVPHAKLHRPVLHYAHVVPEARGYGVGRAVVRTTLGSYPDTIDCTHRWPFDAVRFSWNAFRAGALLAIGG